MAIKTVMHKTGGNQAEVLAEWGGHYWLNDPTDEGTHPWTSPKSLWESPRPKAGDVWVSGSVGTEYRVLGVDEVRGCYLLVRSDDYDNGNWTVPHKGRLQHDADIDARSIYVRELPEIYLTLKERPE